MCEVRRPRSVKFTEKEDMDSLTLNHFPTFKLNLMLTGSGSRGEGRGSQRGILSVCLHSTSFIPPFNGPFYWFPLQALCPQKTDRMGYNPFCPFFSPSPLTQC